jgi:hypothetical protein
MASGLWMPERVVPLTTHELLLRECMLKNSGFILGVVVYTGRESRIQMNSAKTPNKVGMPPFYRASWQNCKASELIAYPLLSFRCLIRCCLSHGACIGFVLT